jgi:hypothetical protein
VLSSQASTRALSERAVTFGAQTKVSKPWSKLLSAAISVLATKPPVVYPARMHSSGSVSRASTSRQRR